MISKIVCFSVALMLIGSPQKGRAQAKFPTVFVLYSSGQVFTADYLYLGKLDKKSKADFRTLFFTVMDSKENSLSHRMVHFVDVKYLLFNPEWWLEGINYVKVNFAREDPVFLPVALTGGSMSKAVFEKKTRMNYYLKIFENEKVGTSIRKNYLGEDFLFNPDDNYGEGRLLVVATSLEYLDEAKQTMFVRRFLKE